MPYQMKLRIPIIHPRISMSVHCCRLLLHAIRPWMALDFGNMGPGGLLKRGSQGTRLGESKQDKYGWGESNWLCNLNIM